MLAESVIAADSPFYLQKWILGKQCLSHGLFLSCFPWPWDDGLGKNITAGKLSEWLADPAAECWNVEHVQDVAGLFEELDELTRFGLFYFLTWAPMLSSSVHIFSVSCLNFISTSDFPDVSTNMNINSIILLCLYGWTWWSWRSLWSETILWFYDSKTSLILLKLYIYI